MESETTDSPNGGSTFFFQNFNATFGMFKRACTSSEHFIFGASLNVMTTEIDQFL